MKPDFGTLPVLASQSELREAKTWLAGCRFKWSPANCGQTLTRPDNSRVYWHVELFVGKECLGKNFADDAYVRVGSSEPKAFAERVQLLLAVKCLRECLAAA